MAERHYSREEMQAILAQAIERQVRGTGQDDLSHAQLLETAREVGLSAAEIDAAIADIDRRRARDVVVAHLQGQARRRLRNHGLAFLLVNAGLWAIDALTAAMGVNQRPGWHWLAAACWGIGLTLHAWLVLSADPATLARKAERFQRQQQRKLQQQQMQRAIEGAVTDAVTTGAEALTRLLDPDRPRKRDRDRRP